MSEEHQEAEVVSVEEDLGALYEKLNEEQPRDEHGRWTRGENDESPEEVETEEESPVEEETAEEVTDEESGAEASEPISAPPSWSKEDGEVFATLSPEAQEIVLRREKERDDALLKATNDFGEQRKQLEPLSKVVSEWSPYFREIGVEKPDQAIDTLIRAEARMRRGTPSQRTQLFAQLAKEYDVDLSPLVPKPEQADEDEYIDPNIATLRQQVTELRAALENSTAEQRRRQEESNRQRQQEANRRSEQQVETFKNAKDDKGNLLHPHFEAVESDMSAFVQNGLSLEDAYERAVYANPEVRVKLLEEQRRAEREAERQKAKAEADKAKKAAKANAGASKPAAGKPVKGKTIEETIGMVYDQMQGA